MPHSETFGKGDDYLSPEKCVRARAHTHAHTILLVISEDNWNPETPPPPVDQGLDDEPQSSDT